MLVTLQEPENMGLIPAFDPHVLGVYAPCMWEYEEFLEHAGWSWLVWDWPELEGKDGAARLEFMRRMPEFVSYGTFDSIDFVKATPLWASLLESEWSFIVTVIAHDKKNGGGLRFHKNGTYLGDKREGYEHFFDEPNIELLYTFRVWRHHKKGKTQ